MYFVLKYNIFWNNNCFVKLINSPHICLTDHNCFFLLKRIIFEYTVLYFSLSLASRHHLVYCPLSLKALYLLHEVCILSAAIIVPNLHIYINSISNTLNLLRTLYHFWNTLYPNWFSWSAFLPGSSHWFSPTPYSSPSGRRNTCGHLRPFLPFSLYSILLKFYQFFLKDVSPFHFPPSFFS